MVVICVSVICVFYFSIHINSILLQNTVAKTIDLLNIHHIIEQKDECQFKGGVEDHGDFLEGFCFKLQIADIDGKDVTKIWEICANTRVIYR